MFKISDFKTNINQKGVVKNNKYIATVGMPGYLSGKWSGFDRTLRFRCEAVQMPGLQFASADGPPRLGYGPIERHPYNVNYEDVSLSFLLDAETGIHNFFYDWCNSIFNFKGSGGKGAKDSNGMAFNAFSYEVGYKDSYAANINIDVYHDNGSHLMKATLYEAFPMAFPTQALAWGEGDLMRLTIPFTYMDFKVDYDSRPSSDTPYEPPQA